jgi:hypothetical protein
MSVESRSPLRVLRRSKREDERPDYSNPTSPDGRRSSTTSSRRPKRPFPQPAPAVAQAPVEQAPVAQAVDNRPSLEAVLETLLGFDGALCVAVVDSDSGMILGKAGSGVDMDLAAANASVILRARLASTKALGTKEKIDDMLISLSGQVQIIHPLPSNPSIFTYLVGDKSRSSLAMARFKATEADLLIRL